MAIGHETRNHLPPRLAPFALAAAALFLAGAVTGSARADGPFVPAPAPRVALPPQGPPPPIPESREQMECVSDFRLDDAGGPLEKVPVRDQSSVPNCYAHAGAVMLDAWGLSHAPPEGYVNRDHRSSPYWGSVRASVGDRIDQNLDWLRQNGTCDQSSLLEAGERNGLDGMLAYQIRFNQDWPKLRQAWSDAQGCSGDGVQRIAEELFRQVKATLFPHAGSLTLDTVADAISKSSVDAMLEYLYNRACDLHVEYPRIPAPKRVVHEGRDASVTLFINRFFNRHAANRQPVGLGICGEMLKTADNGFDRGPGMWDYIHSDKCHIHAVAAIGRRWNSATRRCQILIRNSWGTDCAGYRSGMDCESGQLWVDSDLLDRFVIDTITLGE